MSLTKLIVGVLLIVVATSAHSAATKFAFTCGATPPPIHPCTGVINARGIGKPNDVWVAAVDENGTPDENYTGIAYFTSSDPTATLPTPRTFLPSDRGSIQFTYTFNSLGTVVDPSEPLWHEQTLTVYDPTNALLPVTATIPVEDYRSATPVEAPSLSRVASAFLVLLMGLSGAWLQKLRLALQ